MITRFRIPSFVVTLAGSLTLVGLQLYVLGETGTINLSDKLVIGLTNTYLPPLAGWIIALGAIALTLVFALAGRARRKAAGLQVGSMQGLSVPCRPDRRRVHLADLRRQPGPRAAARSGASSSRWRSRSPT